jgi:nicotinamidase-related amidase
MSRRAVIIADVENGDVYLPGILWLAERADLVIVSRDGTSSAKIPASLKRVATYTVTRGIDPDKPNYSAFDGGTLRPIEPLETILARERVTEVAVCGHTLESVVAQTAFDASALGYVTTVCRDISSIGVDETIEGAAEMYAKLARAGIAVTKSGDIWPDATG